MKAKLEKARKLFLVGFFWAILIVSFVFFSGLIILKANGYKVNINTWELKKTGMIVLDADPHGTIMFDGKALKNQRFPSKISNLNEGTYTIDVTQPGYQSWERVVAVEAGQASVFDQILLFKESPSPTNAPVTLTAEALAAEMKNYQTDLVINGTEISYQNNLVTRFSQNIAGAVVYPDSAHIVFQVNDQIRVMDLDGTNNKLLFKINSAQPTSLSFRQGGDLVIYWDAANSKALARIIH
jgi:hypothetical protein